MKGIIVPGASKERMIKRLEGAILLYHQDENSFLILSGYDSQLFDIDTIAKNYQIPVEKILIEGKSRTTRENALYCKRMAEKIGVEEINVVSDSWHIARVRKNFNSQFDERYKKNFYAVQNGLKAFAYLPFEILAWFKLLLDKKGLLDRLLSSLRKNSITLENQNKNENYD